MWLRVLSCWWNKTRISSCILNMDVKRTTYLLNIRHSLWRRANARNVSFSIVSVANLHFQLSWYIQITLLPLPTQHHSFFRNFHPWMKTWEDVMIPRGQHDFFMGSSKICVLSAFYCGKFKQLIWHECDITLSRAVFFTRCFNLS